MAYSAADLIDKYFKAEGTVPLYRHVAEINAPQQPFGFIQPGQIIGQLFSWVQNTNYNPTLWWMFYDNNGIAYYVPHKEGNYIDGDYFKEQGVLTVEEKAAAEAYANQEWYEKIFDKAKPFIIVGLVGFLAIKALK